jgi:glutamate synthase domain-containing protein 1
MCGIVGLFLKDKSLEPNLGSMLSDMLVTMTDRGPDSAGIAIYGKDNDKNSKLTIQSDTPDIDFADLGNALKKILMRLLKRQIKMCKSCVMHSPSFEQMFAL